jgi:hypothetical protein
MLALEGSKGYNPFERVEKQVAEYVKKVDKLTDLLKKFSISKDV